MKFTKQTLKSMLDMVIDEYFNHNDEGLGLWEIVEYVKDLYIKEINTLED